MFEFNMSHEMVTKEMLIGKLEEAIEFLEEAKNKCLFLGAICDDENFQHFYACELACIDLRIANFKTLTDSLR